jgi:uncharacterized membrane protein YfhO
MIGAAAFLLLYAVMLHPLIAMKAGFVLGDYEVQMFPWTFAYAQALKEGTLLLWTPLIQCGFPLFAEGQTGMLYLPNLLLFKFLPFKAAYNAMLLLHFLAGGAFTYLFGRKKAMSREGAAVAATAFTFGSAYAGCFYNIVAMRSLVWFPLALYCADKFLEKRKVLPLFLLAFAQSLSWLGGFPQLAAYAAFFILVYFLLRLRQERAVLRDAGKMAAWFLGALGLSAAIALPQLWATWELAAGSTRLLHGKEFTLWGTVAPWSLVTVFFYSWGMFLRYKVYIGIWPVLSVLLAGFQKRFALWWILTGLSLFFALGAFNPVNWLLIHLPGASLLRNPSKFLFFTAFFLSVTAGLSFDALSRRFIPGAVKVLAVFFVIALAAWGAVTFGSDLLLGFGRWYTDSFVTGKSFHRGSYDHYLAKINTILGMARREIDLSNPFFWAPFLFDGLFVAWLALKERWKSGALWKAAFFLILGTDLFLFGKFSYGTGFIGNIGPFPDVSRFESLEKDGRWLDLTRGDSAVFPPNRNLLTGHAQIGAYSPLLDRHYYLLTKDLGAVDDAFGRTDVSVKDLGPRRPLIDLLGVKYLIAGEGDQPEDFKFLRPMNGKRLYLNEGAHDEFYLASGKGFRSVRVLENRPMSAAVEVNSAEGGLLIRSQAYTKDWEVRVDGRRVKLERVHSALQGVEVPKGGHRVEWLYAPVWFTIGRWFYAGGLALVLVGIVVFGVLPVRGRVA